MTEITELDSTIELVEDCQRRAMRPRERRELLNDLAVVEAKLHGMHKRSLEALLEDFLWRYMDYAVGTEAEEDVMNLLIRLELGE